MLAAGRSLVAVRGLLLLRWYFVAEVHCCWGGVYCCWLWVVLWLMVVYFIVFLVIINKFHHMILSSVFSKGGCTGRCVGAQRGLGHEVTQKGVVPEKMSWEEGCSKDPHLY